LQQDSSTEDLKFSAEALTAVRLEDALIDPEVPRKGVRCCTVEANMESAGRYGAMPLKHTNTSNTDFKHQKYSVRRLDTTSPWGPFTLAECFSLTMSMSSMSSMSEVLAVAITAAEGLGSILIALKFFGNKRFFMRKGVAWSRPG